MVSSAKERVVLLEQSNEGEHGEDNREEKEEFIRSDTKPHEGEKNEKAHCDGGLALESVAPQLIERRRENRRAYNCAHIPVLLLPIGSQVTA